MKKRSKKLLSVLTRFCPERRDSGVKSFLVLFFKKELLACLALSICTVARAEKIVLIAGDNSLPVFDNATASMARQLARPGDSVQRLSAQPAPGLPSATLAHVLHAVAAMRPSPGEGCLVFATSHGAPHEGLWLSRAEEFLTPAALDRALAVGCGKAPTVVVISSCYSGSFARPPMARANRVVLTAARADRSSFGCGAGRTYTVYDQCLLAALEGQGNIVWRQVYTSVQGCVRREERIEDVRASEPQAWFGAGG